MTRLVLFFSLLIMAVWFIQTGSQRPLLAPAPGSFIPHSAFRTPHLSQRPLFTPAPGSPIPVAAGPGPVIAEDVNNDGHPDIIVGQGQSRVVTVLLGNGKGAFTPAPGPRIGFGYPPGEMDLGDVNNDGILDLGVTTHDSYDVDILLGDGKGGFKMSSGSPFTASAGVKAHTHGFAFADVNGDRKLDIITANNEDHNIAVMLGDGRGGFTRAPASPFGVGPRPYPFGVWDVDGDGNIDVVTPSSVPDGRTVTVMTGDGKGGFREALGSPIPVPPTPYFIALGDINGDRYTDIAASHDDRDLVTILLNDGKGRFRPAPGSPYRLGFRAFELVLADVNRDMKTDLTAATGRGVTVLLGDGKGGLSPAPGSPFRAGPGVWRLATGDFNQDGRIDIVASNLEGNSLTVLLGN